MNTRTPLIAGNWKMYKTGEQAVESARRLVESTMDAGGTDILIAPPFTALASVSQIVENTPVLLGAQNMHHQPEGAYTGEISAAMLKSAGCSHVILGHSERRQYFGETDDGVNRKIKAALNEELIPILCIGETESERELGRTNSVLDKQLTDGVKNISFDGPDSIVVAYEPVWAIGTGKTATREQAQEAHRFIRSVIEKTCGNGLAKSVRILYGGSVKPDNAAGLMAMPDIDGALVGGASLDAEVFSKIVHFKK